VADLGGAMGRLHPPSRKFFRFFPAKANEKQVHTTSNASQNVFLPMIAPPSKILDPPLRCSWKLNILLTIYKESIKNKRASSEYLVIV
jgi:hypothetical protein